MQLTCPRSTSSIPRGRRRDKIAYTVESADQSTREIWVMNADGSGKTQLTTAPNFSANPNWSPDGQWIVFDSDRAEKGNLDVYKMHADGSGVVAADELARARRAAAFSPDGTKIVFVSDRARARTAASSS